MFELARNTCEFKSAGYSDLANAFKFSGNSGELTFQASAVRLLLSNIVQNNFSQHIVITGIFQDIDKSDFGKYYYIFDIWEVPVHPLGDAKFSAHNCLRRLKT